MKNSIEEKGYTEISERLKFSNDKLNIVRQELNNIEDLSLLKDICIYVTGSFARGEASPKSDLDLFFITKSKDPVPKLDKILVDAELIRLNKKLNFPDFSKDGEYLTIHNLDEIMDIGSQKEDYKNYFTARMLLLLESRPLFNDKIYEEVIKEVIDSYLRDFHKHEVNFKPIFLVNDILRYWKTLCLNYEHKRNRIVSGEMTKEEESQIKVKAHKKNLKLQFSRKLTCFSFILSIVDDYVNDQKKVSHETIIDIVMQKPTEILLKLKNDERVKVEVDKSLELYTYFLNLSKKDDSWIEDKKNRDEAFTKSREFGDCIYNILINLIGDKNTEILKYIVL